MNLALKFYGQNAKGYPEKWPAQVQPTDAKTVPAGYDVLMTEDEYQAHVSSLKAAADAASAAIKSAPALAEKADADAKEDQLKQIETAVSNWSSSSITDKLSAIRLMMLLFPFIVRKLMAK